MSVRENQEQRMLDAKNALKSKVADMTKTYFTDKQLSVLKDEVYKLVEGLQIEAMTVGYGRGFDEGMDHAGDSY